MAKSNQKTSFAKSAQEAAYQNKLQGCWAGKAIAGAIGAPYEGHPYELDLKPADEIPLDIPNDDLELQLIWLIQAEKYGVRLTSTHLAEIWKLHFKHGCDEYSIAQRNLRRGLLPPWTGLVDNAFVNGMGAAIRSEIWACLFPGNPEAAAHYAEQDAMVDHWGEGVWAESFLAAVESQLFVNGDIITALRKASRRIPKTSRVREMIDFILGLYAKGCPETKALPLVRKRFFSHNFTDCIMNLSFIVTALCWGRGNFRKTVRMAVNFGMDTDCTAATCGAILGIAYGIKIIPKKWLYLVRDEIKVSPYIRAIPGVPFTFTELNSRIFKLRAQIAAELPKSKKFSPYVPANPATAPVLSKRQYLILSERDLPDPDQLACLEKELMATGRCSAKWRKHIVEFSNLHLDLSRFVTDGFPTLYCFSFLTLKSPMVEEPTILSVSDLGHTLFLDRKLILNYHGRNRSIPSSHRAEGGAAFQYPLPVNQPILVTVRIFYCRKPLNYTLLLVNNYNDILDNYEIAIK